MERIRFNMKRLSLLTLILLIVINNNMNSQEKETEILIKTSLGNIKVKLYNNTPLHRDNLLKLVDDGTYTDLLFHRVIKDFMIQGGDPESRNASDSAMLGMGDLGYTVDAEFRLPENFHKKGALSAARMGDDINPKKSSSASQFYIVTGKTFTEDQLRMMEKQRFERLKQGIFAELQTVNHDSMKALYKGGDRSAIFEFRNKMQEEAEQKAAGRITEAKFTPEQIEAYTTSGGTPHLDGEYTVYGEVTEGLDIVDMIQNAATKRGDRPVENIRFTMERIKE